MKTLIVDFSPVLYRWLFSTTSSSINQMKLKKGENGLYDFSKYKAIYIHKTLDYITKFKNRFGVDEVVIAADSSPYWRSDYWSGYKYGRMKNDESGIDWKAVKKTQREMINLLKEASTFKVIDLSGIEGDDVGFVLAEELSNRGHEIIVKSLDHDWVYNLKYKNVKYWETKHNTPNKRCGYVEFNLEDIERLKFEHCFYGDKGDYILAVNAFTEFSPEFKEVYADKIAEGLTPLKVWPKRHEVDMGFKEKHANKFPELTEKDKLTAWKHPRFGAKSFNKKMLKENFTTDDYMETNPIHQLNFDLNAKIALPENIPEDIRQDIIDEYDNSSVTLDAGKLSKYFMDYGIMDLVGKVGLF